ncbi:MAG: oligosaccharide flippase family protein [Deltaproteobacteria bacterium]|nr:oligosaccharide flippase family protein [Deltaproteobacteria bacterium]
MSQFLRVTMLLGSVTVINLLVSIVRTKIVALYVGKAGMAVLAQLADWQTLLATYVLLGSEQGLVALSADAWARHSREGIERLLRVVRTRIAPPVALALLVLALASPWLMPAVTGHDGTVLAGAGATLSLLLQLWVRPRQSILNGAKAFGLIARSKIIESLSAVAVVIPLVLAFGLPGAMWSLAVVHLSSLLATAWVWRQLPLPAVAAQPEHGNSQEGKTLRQFGGAILITGGAASLISLLLRRRIIEVLGLEQAGLWQVAHSLTLQYLGIVLGAMSAYSFPAYRAAAQRPGQLEIEVNQTLRSVLLVITPIIVGLLTLREILILVLFSRDFSGAADLMQIQLVGDLFKVVAWATGLTLLASGRVWQHVALDLFFGGTWVLGVEIASRQAGGLGPSIGFAVNQVLMCIGYLAVNRWVFGLRVRRSNLGLLAGSAILIVGTALLSHAPLAVRALGAALGLLVWAWLGVRREEVVALRAWLASRIGRLLGRSKSP